MEKTRNIDEIVAGMADVIAENASAKQERGEKPGTSGSKNPFGKRIKGGNRVSGGFGFGDAGESEESHVSSILAKASKIGIFGQNLAGLAGGLVRSSVHQLLTHKTELIAGGVAGGVVKAATRFALAGSGGWVVAGAAGALGGGVSGGVKEYIRQREEGIEIEEVDRTRRLASLRNEWRRAKAVDRKKIAIKIGVGAGCGLVGGLVGAEVSPIITEWAAHNEIIQGGLSFAGTKLHEGWSGAGQAIQEHFQNAAQPPEVVTSPSVLPSNVPAMPEVVASPVEQPQPPVAPKPPVAHVEQPQPPVAPKPPIEHVTAPNGAVVSGSAADNSLTYNGRSWALLDNGTKNIGHLFKVAGQTGSINHDVLGAKLQEATNLWAHGQLNPSTNGDLYRVFHLSNGTASLYNSLLKDDENTLKSLINLGIITK